MKKTIAIIGGGISGLSCAWMLEEHYSVTLYEKEAELGGHAKTYDFIHDGMRTSLNTQFSTFSSSCKYIRALLEILEVPLCEFAFTTTYMLVDKNIKYHFPALSTNGSLTGRLSSTYMRYGLILRCAISEASYIDDYQISLEEFFSDKTYISEDFKHDFFYPLFSVIWGAPVKQFPSFSAKIVADWFNKNHICDIFPDKTFNVKGSNRAYLDVLLKELKNTTLVTSANVEYVDYKNNKWFVSNKGMVSSFDKVIFATSAKNAASLIREQTEITSILSKIQYTVNSITVHTDSSLLLSDTSRQSNYNEVYNSAYPKTYGTVWHGRNYNLPFFVTARAPEGIINKDKILELFESEHVILDKEIVKVRKLIEEKQGENSLWFVGGYLVGDAGHDAAIQSAFHVCKQLSAASKRLNLLSKKVSTMPSMQCHIKKIANKLYEFLCKTIGKYLL